MTAPVPPLRAVVHRRLDRNEHGGHIDHFLIGSDQLLARQVAGPLDRLDRSPALLGGGGLAPGPTFRAQGGIEVVEEG